MERSAFYMHRCYTYTIFTNYFDFKFEKVNGNRVLTNNENTMRNHRSALIMFWFLCYHIEIDDSIDNERFYLHTFTNIDKLSIVDVLSYRTRISLSFYPFEVIFIQRWIFEYRLRIFLWSMHRIINRYWYLAFWWLLGFVRLYRKEHDYSLDGWFNTVM